MLSTKSLDLVKAAIASEKITLESVQHFPPVPFYSDLLKNRAKPLFKTGDSRTAISLLSHAHCIGLHHRTISVYDNLSKGKCNEKRGASGDSPELFQDSPPEQDLHLQFQNICYPDWLQELPSDWTVVQITEIRTGKEMFKEIGGPPCPYSLPTLMITRLPCGSRANLALCHELERPVRGVECGGLLNELNAILEGNRRANNEFRGHRDMYFKVKQEHHNQLKVLVNSLENWWLGYCKCLLVGELKDPADVKVLNGVTAAVVKLVKKLKGNVTQMQEQKLRLLLSSYCLVNRQQLILGIAKSLNLLPRSTAVGDILKYLNTVEADLTQLKNAQRNPVILILDKVIQQLPWESMTLLENTPISRVPSLYMLHTLAQKHGFKKRCTSLASPVVDLKLHADWNTSKGFGAIQVNPKRAFYVLNPGQDLPGVQQRLQPILERIWGKQSGVIGTVPIEQDIKQSLKDRDVFLYCGHGSGTKYFSSDHIVKLHCRAAPLLMGCSSGQLKAIGRQIDPTGAAANYMMAGSPSVVGMLWEVTDLDCDRFTIRFLDLWLGARQGEGQDRDDTALVSRTSNLPPPPDALEPELIRAVNLSRHVTKYFLTGSAVVVYGLPVIAGDT